MTDHIKELIEDTAKASFELKWGNGKLSPLWKETRPTVQGKHRAWARRQIIAVLDGVKNISEETIGLALEGDRTKAWDQPLDVTRLVHRCICLALIAQVKAEIEKQPDKQQHENGD